MRLDVYFASRLGLMQVETSQRGTEHDQSDATGQRDAPSGNHQAEIHLNQTAIFCLSPGAQWGLIWPDRENENLGTDLR